MREQKNNQVNHRCEQEYLIVRIYENKITKEEVLKSIIKRHVSVQIAEQEVLG
ncbi:MAG: hypothetical protein QM657_15630 [Lacrimispora sp.]|uniref:hypothetical protein n=1 Tax=Lacrimispora sp. TaxID=2719234 RepID=UPI0039E40B00